FDPNMISAEDWKKLGLRDKTIATILNFRSKGGKFRKPEDIKKIWGLFPDEAERLMPYVQIAQAAPAYEQRMPTYANTVKPTLAHIDINAADSNAFIALPGIGSKLSQRIINFRNRLGGFYDVEQVKETFGLHDSVFQKIKPMLQVDGGVKRININTATLEELKMHPYIKYHLANAMVQYRQQHGNFSTVDDLRRIMIVTDEIFKKLRPYLVAE
ncbi:MAG: helix-hairpin-helix domain-containing protein, partial [Chitinophagaceae bacterium]